MAGDAGANALESVEGSSAVSPEVALAAWRVRAGAFAVDTAPGFAVIFSMATLTLTAPGGGWLRGAFVAVGATVLLALAMNRLVLPNAIGWTLGRALFGISVRRSDPQGVCANVSGWRILLRELAHLLDTLSLGAGWLWPLRDRRRRTFADLVAGTEVHRVRRPESDIRRVVAGVLIVVAMLCASAVGLGYALVYRQERAVDEARVQIAAQGPRIVEQMLSYGADTLSQDFARAQALAADGYRPRLIAQQEAVWDAFQKGEATTKKYRAVSSAVLPDPAVTPDRATMLLAMQGERGVIPEDLKFITATVRVDFVRSPEGQWLVASLTSLKKPEVNKAGQ